MRKIFFTFLLLGVFLLAAGGSALAITFVTPSVGLGGISIIRHGFGY